MAEFPAELSTGMVHGRFIVAVIDSDDEGQEPDVVPAQGKVAFKASVGYIPVPVATGGPVTVMKGPIMGVLDDDGYLCTPHPTTGEPMYRGVRLVSTDDPDMAVTDWTWSADYRLEAVNGNSMQIPAHSFALPSGAELDLTTLVKVPSSPGYGLPQAEAAVLRAEAIAQSVRDDADAGLFNGEAATVEVGTVTSGITADVVNVGDEQHAILNITLEKGAKGDPGPAGISNADQFYTVAETAGRTVTIWDYLNNREQLIYGDTGERDISSLLVNATGLARLQRTGGTVHLYLQSIKPTITGSGVFLNLPSGFRPSIQRAFQLNVSSAGSTYRSAYMFTSGGVGAWLQDPTDNYSFTYSFPTANPWPTTLPGVAA